MHFCLLFDPAHQPNDLICDWIAPVYDPIVILTKESYPLLVFCDVQLIIVSFLGFRLADLLGGAPPVALASGSLDEALATSIALPGRADHIDSHAARNYSGSFHDILLSFYLLFL